MSGRRACRPRRDGSPRSGEVLPRRSSELRLGPARDTGLHLGPPPRRRRRRRRSRGPEMTVVLAAVAILAMAAVAMGIRSNGAGGETPSSGADPASYTVELLPDPTPVFATYRSLQLRVPIRPEEITAVAFHQAAGPDALHMESLAPDADMRKAEDGELELTPAAAVPSGPGGVPAILEGQVLRMWRSSRSGRPDTACDCGAKPGTTVYAPVDGEVAEVRKYKLYGKHSDYEIHITPDGWPEVDVVLIHVSEVKVRPGDRVEAGATPLAVVRKLSDRVDHQLRLYTGDGGDHVHMQLNEVAVPGRLERVGGS